MSILKRKGDITTSGVSEDRGRGKVISMVNVVNKTTGKVTRDYIFDEETRKQIYDEYQKEKEEHKELPPAVVYSVARDHILKKRDLELYQ